MISDQILRTAASFLCEDLTVEEFAKALPDGWDLDNECATRAERRSTMLLAGYIADAQKGHLGSAQLLTLVYGVSIELAGEMANTLGAASATSIKYSGASGELAANYARSDPQLVLT